MNRREKLYCNLAFFSIFSVMTMLSALSGNWVMLTLGLFLMMFTNVNCGIQFWHISRR